MLTKTQLKSVLDAMTKEELRDAFLEALSASKPMRESFVAKRLASKAVLEDQVLLEAARKKANALVCAVRKNTADEETIMSLASRRLKGRYFDTGMARDAAIENEVKEAVAYVSELAKAGRVKVALEFARTVGGGILEALEHCPVQVDWEAFDMTHLWQPALENAEGTARKELFDAILEEIEAEEVPGSHLRFLYRIEPEPELAERLIALSDRAIEAERKRLDFHGKYYLPLCVEMRLAFMQLAGVDEAETEDYLVSTFSDCGFTQEILLKRAESRRDEKGVLEAYRALLSLESLPEGKRKDYAAKLAELQLATGDSAGQIETLRDAALKKAADLEDLRRLRELLPAAEWEAMLSGFVKSLSLSRYLDAYPGLPVVGALLRDAGDLDRLWSLVKKSGRRSEWLAFADVLAPLHADAYGDFLLDHLGPDGVPSFGFLSRGAEPVAVTYARWAEIFKQASEIPGQREKAFAKARAFAAAHPRTLAMKAEWEKAGLPGYEKPKAKSARQKKNS